MIMSGLVSPAPTLPMSWTMDFADSVLRVATTCGSPKPGAASAQMACVCSIVASTDASSSALPCARIGHDDHRVHLLHLGALQVHVRRGHPVKQPQLTLARGPKLGHLPRRDGIAQDRDLLTPRAPCSARG